MSPIERATTPYIVGRGYDWTFFLLPPTVALFLGVAISGTSLTHDVLVTSAGETTAAGLFIGVLIHAHLVAVLFRSHGNPRIFRRYRVRFVIVPVVLYLAVVSSPWVAVASTVVATFWDVWHSGAQTFGFARIYDRNAGSAPEVGRRLDFWLNQLLYAGPILAGVTLMDHVEDFESFADVGSELFARVPAYVEVHRRWLTWGVLSGGTVFLAYYLYSYVQLARRGHRVPFVKVFLLTTTGLCSIYTWGFNSWGEAFFIMNFFHGVQYLALVWAVEKKEIRKRLGALRLGSGRAAPALLFFGTVFAYGLFVETFDPELESLWALTMVVSLLHFWYDAFIWSVRAHQV